MARVAVSVCRPSGRWCLGSSNVSVSRPFTPTNGRPRQAETGWKTHELSPTALYHAELREQLDRWAALARSSGRYRAGARAGTRVCSIWPSRAAALADEGGSLPLLSLAPISVAAGVALLTLLGGSPR